METFVRALSEGVKSEAGGKGTIKFETVQDSSNVTILSLMGSYIQAWLC